MLAKVYFDNLYPSFATNYDATDLRLCHLIKVHYSDNICPPEDGSVILTCYRDLRGAAGSMIRMGWLSNDKQALLNWCGEYVRTKARLDPIATLAMCYEHMLEEPVRVAADIASQLGLHKDLARQAVVDVANLQPPASEPTPFVPHDKVTQLHPGHVGDRLNARSASYISRTNLDAIENTYASWFTEHGYPLSLIPRR